MDTFGRDSKFKSLVNVAVHGKSSGDARFRVELLAFSCGDARAQMVHQSDDEKIDRNSLYVLRLPVHYFVVVLMHNDRKTLTLFCIASKLDV